ncbi:MAG: type II secretion system protein [Planctomycetota bacterium]|jgi:type II secretory pathway pseudopilin PulG
MTGEATKRRSGEATKGFTLVEMVIVIGVIILLAALTLSVSVAVVEGSEVRQTENTIRLLTAAIQAWEAQADRQITYGKYNEPYGQGEQYEIEQPAMIDEQSIRDSTAWLLAIISRPASVKQILAQVGPEFVEPIDFTDPNDNVLATFEFTDAWDSPIVAVFPGRTWVNGDDTNFSYYRDTDGTIRTPLEDVCGGATNRQICFVSAGPDGEFGDLTQPPDTDAFKQAKDNVYSYEPDDVN